MRQFNARPLPLPAGRSRPSRAAPGSAVSGTETAAHSAPAGTWPATPGVHRDRGLPPVPGPAAPSRHAGPAAATAGTGWADRGGADPTGGRPGSIFRGASQRSQADHNRQSDRPAAKQSPYGAACRPPARRSVHGSVRHGLSAAGRSALPACAAGRQMNAIW